MDFSLSDTQLEVQGLVRKILQEQADDAHLKELEQAGENFDRPLWSLLAESGLLGLALDEAQGGAALGFETLCLLAEECGRRAAPLPVVPCLAGAALTLHLSDNEEQRQRWLPAVATGSTLLTVANLEPSGAGLRTPTTQLAAGALHGRKHCVAYAEYAERILVSALDGDELLLAWVDPAAPGASLEAQLCTTREPQSRLTLDGYPLQEQEILARGQQAQCLAMECEQRQMAALCAFATGMTDTMMRMTASYTSEREQFGRKIATFQAVGQRAADCYIDVECLRLVSQQAISLIDRGQDAAAAAAVAKIWCGDILHRVSQASQHLHGGTGVDRDYPLHRYCLLARQLELTLGSSAQLTQELGQRIAAERLEKLLQE